MSPLTKKMIAAALSLLAGAFLLINAGPAGAAGGDLDTTFDPGTGADGTVYAAALQSDGKVVVAGSFANFNGTPRNRVARLNPDGSLDTSFNPGIGASDRVMTAATQADGKVIIGGDFVAYNNISRNRVARLNSDGSLDASFNPGTAANGAVWAMAVQPDGKVVVGGSFGAFVNIARLTSDGSADAQFNASTNGPVYAVALQSDGKVVIGGNFTTCNNTPRNRVARLNPDGSLDTSFDSSAGANFDIYAVALQSDGKVVIGGAFISYAGTPRKSIARLNSDGSLDTSFNVGTGATFGNFGVLWAVAVQPDGKVVIGGSFTAYNGTPRGRVARLHTDGSLDTTFGSGADAEVKALALQPNGRVIIGGDFANYNGTSRNRVARLLPANGVISFSSASYSVNEAAGSATITLTRTGGSDGAASARVSLADVTTSPADYAYRPGALDPTFTPGSGANLNPQDLEPGVFTVALQPDGKAIIAGRFNSYNGTARNRLARINPDGSLDPTFNPGPSTYNLGASQVVTAALQSDGKVVIGGHFTTFDGASRNHIARLNPDGSLDTSFNPGTAADEPVLKILLQPDGKILIGGNFNSYNGTARRRIARLNSDGSLDTSFNPGTGADFSVSAVALQADGRVIIGGAFTDFNGTLRHHTARLNTDGSLDTSFAANTDKGVSAVAIQPDGKILIGGIFTSCNGVPRKSMARVNPDGSVDNSFNAGLGAASGNPTPGTDLGPPTEIALQPDGKILIVGGFVAYNGTPRKSIARLNPDGSLDASFDPGAGTGGQFAQAMALQPDGKILIGGFFTNYDGILRPRVARVYGDILFAWADGDASSKTFVLPIVNDTLSESNETLTLALSSVGGATVGTPNTATLTILDNETVVSTVSGAGTFGGTATLTATLSSAGDGLSGKTVSFTLNGAAVCGVAGKPDCPATNASGVATLNGVSLSGLDAGTHNGAVGAAFAGDTSHAGSSGTGPLNVAKADTTTALISSVNPSASGQSVTFTATVTPATSGTPTGVVRFKVDGADFLLSPTPLVGNVATLTTSALAPGVHSVRADYGGDSNFNASTGALASGQTVGAVFEFSQAAYTVAERGGSVAVAVRRAGNTGAASIDYSTDDGSIPSVAVSCSATAGQALERCDYTRAAGTLQFAAGETEKTFTVLVSDDSFVEGAETTSLKLLNPSAGAGLGAQAAATLGITDDVPESSGNPLDDDRNFVRQQYHDFLNREPDANGWDFWTNEITSCNADQQCREVKRINVSAAFFLSIEFQETGFLVERIYKTAYGDATGVSTFPAAHTLAVPVVRAQEFLRDTQEIGRGVVVGVGDWKTQLENNKNAFALAFVRRQRFKDAFPTSLTADQFVVKLDAGAGGVLTDAERAQLDLLFGGPNASSGDDAKRAQALRAVAENAALAEREKNRAFVLMQYFGYLRRDPDAAPDTNHTGYDFWLTKLGAFGGNFVNAEMVKAFISSDEYRRRFGQ